MNTSSAFGLTITPNNGIGDADGSGGDGVSSGGGDDEPSNHHISEEKASYPQTFGYFAFVWR